jgi:hypothetical protein
MDGGKEHSHARITSLQVWKVNGFKELFRVVGRHGKNSLFLADKCYPVLRKLFISQCLKLETKFKLYETSLRVALKYAAES